MNTRSRLVTSVPVPSVGARRRPLAWKRERATRGEHKGSVTLSRSGPRLIGGGRRRLSNLSSRGERMQRCYCQPDDSSSTNVLDRITELQSELDEAIDLEDYTKAASIRDKIKHLTKSTLTQVAKANEEFYKAFESGKISDMKRIWGQGNYVRVTHPGSGCIVGREQVLTSWEHILKLGAYKIEVDEVQVCAVGNKAAMVTCVEYVDS